MPHSRLATSPICVVRLRMLSVCTTFRSSRDVLGITRTSLYRAFAGGKAHPNFSTVLSVLHAMGFRLHVDPARARSGEDDASQRLKRRPHFRIGSTSEIGSRGLAAGCLLCPGLCCQTPVETTREP
ncbi:hypothetical protein [Bradyrhizobium sp. i1.15.2]|uniref:helix-turn-helix domain-containing transcriptional regulator n=1 Tax=Bradyrhizobium sp. i1.15.2 TaxID=3156362 RepID=UPI003399C39A